jgi:hypothetical protein
MSERLESLEVEADVEADDEADVEDEVVLPETEMSNKDVEQDDENDHEDFMSLSQIPRKTSCQGSVKRKSVGQIGAKVRKKRKKKLDGPGELIVLYLVMNICV